MLSIWFSIIVGLLLILVGILELTVDQPAAVPVWYGAVMIAIGLIGFLVGFIDRRRIG